MERSRERLCLEKMMEMLIGDKNKKIIIESDFGLPYTLSIMGYDGIEHTHCSYAFPDSDDLDNAGMDKVVKSFMTHILGDGGGLSFHVSKIEKEK
jgi:hypothetical protein